MKNWLTIFLAWLHINSWMLVPHIQHNKISYVTASAQDDLDSFFEYVDEIILSHIDQTPDYDEQDGQVLNETAKQDCCDQQQLINHLHLWLANNELPEKKIFSFQYNPRISLEILAPPPDRL